MTHAIDITIRDLSTGKVRQILDLVEGMKADLPTPPKATKEPGQTKPEDQSAEDEQAQHGAMEEAEAKKKDAAEKRAKNKAKNKAKKEADKGNAENAMGVDEFRKIVAQELIPGLGGEDKAPERLKRLFQEAGGEKAVNVKSLPAECRADVVAKARAEIELAAKNTEDKGGDDDLLD